ncbi:MAG: DUF4230 domain-containing protein [Rubrobacteraceae bacterium]|nr:DUF4230 domain-containing protein [Rubrobacter sp.]
MASSQFRDDREERRSSSAGKVLVLTAIVMVLAAAVGIGLARYGENIPIIGPILFGPDTTTGEVSVVDIRDLENLTTIRWIGQVVVTEEAEPGRVESLADAVGLDTSAFTGESVIVTATGEVEAGVNLEELGERDVRVNEDTVTINLPEPEIFSTSLDEEETGVYDRDRGIFVFGVNDEVAEDARREAVSEIEAAAEESDILAQADTNAEDAIRAFVETLGFEEVRFE